MYGRYSTRGHVERLIKHKAKPSAVFTSRHPIFFVHTCSGASSDILYFLVVLSWNDFLEHTNSYDFQLSGYQ